MTNCFQHHPVLLDEALDGLNIQADGYYIDATFGRGGHAGMILQRLGPEGRLLAIDKDPEAIRTAHDRFRTEQRFSIEQGSFVMLKELAQQRGWLGKVSGILLDLGVSSPQLDDASRGFSFRQDGPLDMRMDPETGVTAAQWLATAEEKEIARVLWEYGEERFSRRIARNIVAARSQTPLTGTAQLAKLIADSVPRREPGKDPATRSFQAIRIYLNQELDELHKVLPQALQVLAPGGRLAVISFHSLEDRIVKRFMREQARGDEFPPDLPVTQAQLRPSLRVIGKARRAGSAELADNPRARSAVLRVAERLA
ncbi:MAG TPA: 16S rRNA (cytosine(1402)-N(4))-methyltransferase RsmH [Gammaproteobacteria bacterium]|nr:16S rRNA (cytosine(1402)-N(4))-methyltransferase RsmH [Gammaproteobacteria bacterium]